tara:strand:+ start:4173 stop:4796 length:624 start_codon:yes stop_codon:yes gene_type:complete
MLTKKSLYFDIGLIAIIHIAGIIGIRLIPELFLKTSFVSIVVPLGLYLFRIKLDRKSWLIILLVYVITFFSEWIGVRFGWLFGSYKYGESLGLKLDGVPILMGFNWLLLALVSRQISMRILKNKWLIILLSALLMVFIDFIIEPLCEKLDFWAWENSLIPWSNYRDWFLIAVLNQWILSFIRLNNQMFIWSVGYVLILVLFFGSFYF